MAKNKSKRFVNDLPIVYICHQTVTRKYFSMEIKEIKTRLTIEVVLASYNLAPDNNNRLCCPWHNDKTPSLQIYPTTNTWTCFSSNCSAGSGDAIDFIMKYEQVTKHEALIKAKELLGAEIETDPNKVNKPMIDDYGKQAILTKYYQSTIYSMQRSKKAQGYAESRNLDHEKIGYCAYDIGKTWKEGLKENAEKLGLFKIKNCLIFPMRNVENQIVSIYGRSISDKNKSKHFYLKGGFRGLYPSYPIVETKTIILTESIIDAKTIKQNTDYEVLALYGTNGMTVEHEQAISNLKELEEIILFFDGDEAGQAAVEKYAEQFKDLKIKVSKVETPQGEDANSLVQSHEVGILNHLIENRNIIFSIEERVIPQGEGPLDLQAREPLAGGQYTAQLDSTNPELLLYSTEHLLITILGGIKITGLDRLRVTLKVEPREYSNVLPVRHSLDLYHSNQVEKLVQTIAEQLELGSSISAKTISEMTGKLEQYRQEQMELLKPKKVEKRSMSEAEKQEAITYLKDPKLLRNTLNDIATSGIVGEQNNSLIAYLAYTSRKRKKPLHIMCLGASGTGKTYLQEKVSELIPEEDKIEITSLSDNAFYYFGRYELQNKLILIEDLDGAENALYPLRELQSKRRIGKTVTVKDNKGKMKTINLKVEGPVCVSSCTTRERIYEDNANRCILLYIDGSSEQDKRIMAYQQAVSSAQINHGNERGIKIKLQNVQRLLRPIKIVNPYAALIDLPQQVFKPRRTLLLLLSFIETITFYHQYQRKVQTNEMGERYIETTKQDIEAAFSLMKEVLFSKSDELTKASRNFLEMLKSTTKKGEVFYANVLRKRLRVPSSTLKRYLYELVRNGYVKIKGGSKYRGFEYEVTDYEEYAQLMSSIDEKLKQILSKIEQGSGSVAHQWLTKVSEPLKTKKVNDLDGVAH